MAGKEEVIRKIARAKPLLTPLPEIPDFAFEGNALDNFIASMERNHGRVVKKPSNMSILEIVSAEYSGKEISVSTIDKIDSVKTINLNTSNLHDIDLAIIEGSMGVGENAAIWVPEKNMPHRAVPFVCEHLIIILKEEDIVGNMHQAYSRIQNFEGYGVFISGPSKTADIEQSLVIGAHGPRSLLVIIS